MQINGTTDSDTPNFKAGKYGKINSDFQRYARKYIRSNSVVDSHRFANHTDEVRTRFHIALDEKLNRLGSNITGISEKNIETYRKNVNEIDRLIKQVDGDFQEAANMAKEKMPDLYAYSVKNLKTLWTIQD